MGRTSLLSLGCTLALSLSAGGAALWAASVSTEGRVSILAPSATFTGQQVVTGMIATPLVSQIGATAGSINLPPQSFSTAGRIRIGTEALQRDIAQVVSRSGLQQASFTIIGDRDQIVSIAVPPSISLARLSGDGEVAFSPVTTLAGGVPGQGRLIAAAGGVGELAFDVGGEVEPSPTATAGDYAGVLRVTVQYN